MYFQSKNIEENELLSEEGGLDEISDESNWLETESSVVSSGLIVRVSERALEENKLYKLLSRAMLDGVDSVVTASLEVSRTERVEEVVDEPVPIAEDEVSKDSKGKIHTLSYICTRQY
jgi:hypothetical protein